jgi:hypothetical protein
MPYVDSAMHLKSGACVGSAMNADTMVMGQLPASAVSWPAFGNVTRCREANPAVARSAHPGGVNGSNRPEIASTGH